MSQEMSIKKGCQTSCGDVTIPYPFGIGPECSRNSSFAITCDDSTSPPTPFLSSINRQVVHISVHGVVIVNQPVSPMSCSPELTHGTLPMSLERSPFTISPHYNSLAVLGCANSVWLLANETTTFGGCTAICQANASAHTSCDGINCCKAAIPARSQTFQFSYRSIQSSSRGFCGYAFPVDKKWFQQDYNDQEIISVPLVLEWELDYHNPMINSLGTCKYAANYRHLSNTDNYTDPSTPFYSSAYYNHHEYASSAHYCSCKDGYQGNPYVGEGCVDIDECAPHSTVTFLICTEGGACANSTVDKYCGTGTCFNKIGSYGCRFADDDNYSRTKIAFISVGSAVGGLILVLAATRARRKRIEAKHGHELFGLELPSTDYTRIGIEP